MHADRPTTEPRTLPRTQAGRDMVAWQAGIGGWDRAYWEKRVREVEDQAFALAEAAQGAAPSDDYTKGWNDALDGIVAAEGAAPGAEGLGDYANPEVRQAAREKINGAANVSQWFAGQLLDVIERVAEGAAPQAEGHVYQHDWRGFDQCRAEGCGKPESAHPPRAEGLDVPRYALDSPIRDDAALEALRHLFFIMERLDKQAGPPFAADGYVRVTSKTWLDLVRPAIRTVQARLSRPSDERTNG